MHDKIEILIMRVLYEREFAVFGYKVVIDCNRNADLLFLVILFYFFFHDIFN